MYNCSRYNENKNLKTFFILRPRFKHFIVSDILLHKYDFFEFEISFKNPIESKLVLNLKPQIREKLKPVL